MVAPWVLRNWLWVGNPFAPFFNSWFPNPYYHPGMERIYAETLRHYPGIKHYWQIPLQLTLRSGFDGGTSGPVFLLAPCGLLALRFKSGRRLLLAGLVFALPAYLNIGTRFLIPSVPFLALAMGIGLADVPAALPVLALFHALVCWPPVLSTYCDPSNWRISSFPGRVALRLDPAEPFILKNHRRLRSEDAHRTERAARRADLLVCRPAGGVYRPRDHRLLRVHPGQSGT